MQRLLLSAIIALLVHIVFFISLPLVMHKSKKISQAEEKAVVITMAYRPLKLKKEDNQIPPVKKIFKKKKAPQKEHEKKLPEKPKSHPIKKNQPLPEIRPEPQAQSENIVEQKPYPMGNIVQKDVKPLNSGKPADTNSLLIMAKPLYKKNPLPEYPIKAKKRGYEGIVELMVQVSEKGKVGNLWIFKSSNYKSLDNQAVRAVKEWVFEPGKRGGIPEQMWVKIPVRFQLN